MYAMDYPDNNSITSSNSGDNVTWFNAGPETLFPDNAGVCIRYRDQQIAVFRFSRRNAWYACQNLCPHKQQMILSRGMIGSSGDEPKVACPFHKRTFSLRSGECLNAAEENISLYPVKVEDGVVFVGIG